MGRDHIIGRHICDVNWIISERGDWIQVTQGMVKWQHFVNMIMNLRVPQKPWTDLYQWIFKEDLQHQDCKDPQKWGTKLIQNIIIYVMTWHPISELHLVVSRQLPDKLGRTTHNFSQSKSSHFHSSFLRPVFEPLNEELCNRCFG
jgi:hypothetical protein